MLTITEYSAYTLVHKVVNKLTFVLSLKQDIFKKLHVNK